MLDTAPVSNAPTTTEIVRFDHIPALMGLESHSWFLRVEDAVFQIARLCSDNTYSGGNWKVQKLSNGAFYIFPDTDERYRLTAQQRDMDEYISAPDKRVDAHTFGMIVTSRVLSELAFVFDSGPRSDEAVCDALTEAYHSLRDYVVGHNHAESKAIFAVLD